MADKEFITKLAARTAIENYACRDCVHSNGKKCEDCEYQDCINFINEVEAADVQPVRKWVNDDIYSPSVDGDYLVYYRGFFHVFERFKGKWYDEDKCDIINDLDKLWWQKLPSIPETTKG